MNEKMNEQEQNTANEQFIAQHGPIVREITCSKCKNAIALTASVGLGTLSQKRDLEGVPGVIEVGLRCPFCGEWYHSYYTTHLIEQQRKEAEMEHHPTRRSSLRGKVTRRFARFQQEIKDRLEANERQKRADGWRHG